MKTGLAIKFRQLLKEWSASESIGSIFAQLFSLKTDEELQEEIEYLYTLYKGTDDYFKSDSIDCWYAIWHKSIRQCDYFKDCYKKNTVKLITDEERKEFKFLSSKCRSKGFSKTEGKDENKLFNETYNRYLHLHEIVRRECEHDSINGNLDSMLWNLIHVDKNCDLMKLFLKVFDFLEKLNN